MKSKLLLCLELVLGGCLIPLVVHAFWATNTTYPNDISLKTPFVRVVPSHRYGITNNLCVFFYIYVLPKDKPDVKSFWGELWVRGNAGNVIAKSSMQPKKHSGPVPDAVPKSWAGKCIQFEFMVATNYLSDSEFDLSKTVDPELGSAGTVYQFNLKEFAAEK